MAHSYKQASLMAELASLKKRLARLERSAKLAHSGTTTGRLRIYDSSGNVRGELGESFHDGSNGLTLYTPTGNVVYQVKENAIVPAQPVPFATYNIMIGHSSTSFDGWRHYFRVTATHLYFNMVLNPNTAAGVTAAEFRVQAGYGDTVTDTIFEPGSVSATTQYEELIDLTATFGNEVVGQDLKVEFQTRRVSGSVANIFLGPRAQILNRPGS